MKSQDEFTDIPLLIVSSDFKADYLKIFGLHLLLLPKIKHYVRNFKACIG